MELTKMREVHKIYIASLEDEIQRCYDECKIAEKSDDHLWENQVKNYIEGLEYALRKAKGIFPL